MSVNLFSNFLGRLEATPPRSLAKQPARDLFVTLSKKHLEQRIGAKATEQTEAQIFAYEAGLRLARRGDVAGAQAALLEADQASQDLGIEAIKFLRIFQLSAWAYIYYKEQRADQARAALYEVLRVSGELEAYGYYTLPYRRIVTLYNLVTIEQKGGNQAAGNALLGDLWHFTQDGSGGKGLPCADWSEATFSRVPTLKENSFQSITQAIARQNTHQLTDPAYSSHYYAEHFYRPLARELRVTNYPRKVVQRWLAAKLAYEDAGQAAFLTQTADFFTQPIAPQFNGALELNLLSQVKWHIQQCPLLAAEPTLTERLTRVTEKFTPGKKR